MLVADQEKKKKERQKVLDRLNSHNDELNKEARQRKKELERKRWYEREREIERSKRTAGI